MNNYIPFLKLKTSEILAIKELSSELKEVVTPFFDFPRKDNFDEDNFKNTTEKMVRSVTRHLSSIPGFYLDNFDIDSTFEIDGMNNYEYLLLSFNNCRVIPVVSIDRYDGHIGSVYNLKNEGEIESNVLAIRLVPEYFESYMAISDDIDDMLGEVIELFDYIDLIFDCRVCLNQDWRRISSDIINFAQSISEIYPIRKFVVTGSSIPPSISDITGVESQRIYTRAELRIWNEVNSALGDSLPLTIGDYGIVSPNYSDIDIIPEAMLNVTAPKIFYSFENNHFIIRGGALRTHPRGFAQYFDLAEILVSEEFYRGRDYSFGDDFLYEKSNSVGSNVTPSSIIKPTINAHVSFMLKDY